MNNTTPIKILTAAVLLTFGFALTANAALINKGVTEMNHEYTVSDTLSARQQAIPLIAASMLTRKIETGCVWHGYAHPRNSPMFISLLMKNGLYFGAV